jgi:hypothetical protein
MVWNPFRALAERRREGAAVGSLREYLHRPGHEVTVSPRSRSLIEVSISASFKEKKADLERELRGLVEDPALAKHLSVQAAGTDFAPKFNIIPAADAKRGKEILAALYWELMQLRKKRA